MNDVLKALSSHTKLERDRGLEKLKTYIKSNTSGELPQLLLQLNTHVLTLENPSTPLTESEVVPWEQIHGALCALCVVIDHDQSILTDEFYKSCLEISHNRLFHGESRVRLCAGELLGCLAKHKGLEIYTLSKNLIIVSIKNCLTRQDEASGTVQEKLQNTSDSVFHDTAGWGNLETNMKALENIIKVVASDFDSCIDEVLLDVIFSSLEHTNRFVRETGFQVCAALVSIHPKDEELSKRGQIWAHGKKFCRYLRQGLADNWSQVRMSASCATRAFLLGIPPSGREEYFGELLPPLCLNRYYIAEGVRIHSQNTWRMLFNVSGVDAVARNLEYIVPFYIKQTQADNHAVREAACSCIAELASKIGTEAVKKYVPDLITELLECFKDDSWPVRDSACVACGNFVSAFPNECRMYIDDLMSLFYINLEDNIPSVRQGAGVAIATVVKAYSQDVILNRVLEDLSQKLDAVSQQPDSSDQFSDLSKKPAQFGVALHDDPQHTDQVMYSCGSLAPKMSRGGAAPSAGGCSASHHFKRPTEAWETTDGAIWLYVNLCEMQDIRQSLLPLLTKISSATLKRNYAHHKNLMETIYKTLPVIFRTLTKNKIKPYLNDFLDGLHYGLKSEAHLLRAASVECLQSLSLLLGPNILSGRIQMTSLPMYEHVKTSFPETIGC